MRIGNKQYRLGYRPDIEGLRAIAILLVIGAHASVPGVSGGFVGVDAFFVLSGFLITGLLIREVADTSHLSFSDFYIRRIRRLFPALIVMLITCSVFAALVLAPDAQMTQAITGVSATVWLSNIHFALNRLDYFSPGNETNIFLHTWSLGVEEQYYLIWPALIFLGSRRSFTRGMNQLRMLLLLIVVVSFVACVVTTFRSPQLAFYMMPLRAWQFGLGAFVWLEFRERPAWLAASCSRVPVREVLGWAGLLMLLGAAYLLDADKPYPGFNALIPSMGAGMVIASGSGGEETAVQRFLSLPPLQAIGRISYSWYLWHWPVLLLGHALTGLNGPGYRLVYVLVSLLLAIVSYWLIESPIRHQRWWLTHKRIAVYSVMTGVVLSLTGLWHWYVYADDLTHAPEQQRIAASHFNAPIIYPMGCDDWYRSDKVKICGFGEARATHTAVLLGDSIAGQWFPAVAKVFDRPGWRLLVVTKSSCPMVDHPFFYSRIGRVYSECATWRDAVLRDLGKVKPDVVIMSSSDSPPFSSLEWTEGSAKVMGSLSEVANQVYVLRATPHLPFDGPECLAEHIVRPGWLFKMGDCSASLRDKHASEVYGSLQKAAARFDNVHLVDMNHEICPDGTCRAEQGSAIVFRDSQHMTATFAGSLAQALGSRLQVSQPVVPAKSGMGM